MRLKGRTAIISGGASGLGSACVKLLAKAGAKVAILDVNEEGGRQLCKEYEPSVTYFRTDVADEVKVQRAIQQTKATFGSIHFAINCGLIETAENLLGDTGPIKIGRFNRVIQANLIGTVNIIRLVAETMIANPPNKDGERGVIVNTASIAAFEGQIGQAAFSASTAAIVGLTLPIARELAKHGIRVATIAPGLFEVPLLSALPPKAKKSLEQAIPFPQRLGQTTEFAQMAMHIIRNSMLNGETIRLDGALRM